MPAFYISFLLPLKIRLALDYRIAFCTFRPPFSTVLASIVYRYIDHLKALVYDNAGLRRLKIPAMPDSNGILCVFNEREFD
jgi:hypothetical protein